MTRDSSGYGRNEMVGIVAVLTFGFTGLVAVLGGGTLVPVIFVIGMFILVPLIAILGEDFPYVEETTDEPQPAPAGDPIETLRDRFARGEIDQEEFERRLEYIVATEDLEFDVDEQLGHIDSGRGSGASRGRELERE